VLPASGRFDRLFANDNQTRLFFVDNAFEDLGNRKRFNQIVGFNQNAAIRTHCQRCSNGFLGLLWSDRYRDDLAGNTSFPDAQGLFDGYLVKWIHRHFDICQFNPGPVRFDPDFDIIVNDPFYGYDNFHYLILLIFFKSTG
jgi:hypothetical protein